ncbi:hypothetical protein [Nocardioides speluncae]|uniref:hypothetical protein n=1 Tax=Nocardioides speluncae TaxID=2670337 RepID=UPI0012B1739D|nr:hypothetical protein [Nocardioides speluncae]
MRYLSEVQLTGAFRRGAAAEQRIPSEPGVFAWLDARPQDAGISLRLFRVNDDGTDDYLDVYEFTPVDECSEDGLELGLVSDVAELHSASARVGARPDRWVNAGVIQDEYADSRR